MESITNKNEQDKLEDIVRKCSIMCNILKDIPDEEISKGINKLLHEK